MPDDLSPDPVRPDLTAASAEEIAEALSFALRYDERGKPRRGGGDLTASIAAERLTEHLRRAGFIVMKMRPTRAHSTGWDGAEWLPLTSLPIAPRSSPPSGRA